MVYNTYYTCTSPWFSVFPRSAPQVLVLRCWASVRWHRKGSFWSKVNGKGQGISSDISDGLAVSSVSSKTSFVYEDNSFFKSMVPKGSNPRNKKVGSRWRTADGSGYWVPTGGGLVVCMIYMVQQIKPMEPQIWTPSWRGKPWWRVIFELSDGARFVTQLNLKWVCRGQSKRNWIYGSWMPWLCHPWFSNI